MLPEDWKKRSVAEVCRSVSVGVVIKPSQYYVSASEGIKAFRSANVKEGQVNNSDWVYFSHKGHNENKKSELKTGDVLVVRTGYPGTACVVTPQYAGCNAIDIVIARPDIQKIIPTYLCLFTNSEYGKSQVANLQGGMAQKHLNVGAYQQVEIPLPPLPEQKKIAAILSTWDRAIEGTEKLLANSLQQKKALMQQLLTGKKRLPGFTEEWKNIALGELEKKGFLELGRGNVISKKDIAAHPGQNPIYSSSVKNCGLMGTYGHYMFDEELISWSVDGGGHFFHRKKHKFSITNVSGYMRVDQKNLNYKFLCSQLQFLHEKLHFDYQTKAHPSVIRDLYILNTPPLAEQKAIAAVLTTADEEITALESDLVRLRQEKKALMQQLLTGKRRVTVD